jgi:putative acetyltransferase
MNNPPSGCIVRACQTRDSAAIRSLLVAAFAGPAEADLVDRLRASGDLVLSLAAERSGQMVGYAAFPRLDLETAERTVPVCGLAPLAVRPACQRQGVGAQLVRHGLATLRERAEALVFVLGDEGYYGRFGFSAAQAAGFASPYAGPHFQALRLSPAAPQAGTVRYPRAFDGL